MAESDPGSAYLICDLESGRVLAQEGDTEEMLPPCSTFKVPIALMGYNEGILTDAANPRWEYDDTYSAHCPVMLDHWKQPHDPQSWMTGSCIWYSQRITEKLGKDKFAKYVSEFDYGNQDVSGDPGKDNGLMRSWLMSSLKISCAGQVGFLKKMLSGALPVSQKAVEMTTALIPDKEFRGKGIMYGKTGSGYIDRERHLQIGRYKGWIERSDGGKTLFACALRHEGPGIGGWHARDLIREKTAFF